MLEHLVLVSMASVPVRRRSQHVGHKDRKVALFDVWRHIFAVKRNNGCSSLAKQQCFPKDGQYFVRPGDGADVQRRIESPGGQGHGCHRDSAETWVAYLRASTQILPPEFQ